MPHRSIIVLLLLSFFACKNKSNEQVPTPILEDSEKVRQLAMIDIVLADIFGLFSNHTYQLYLRDTNGRIETHQPEFNHFAGYGNCAALNLDVDLNLLELDFGAGCEDEYGFIRSGKLQLFYDYADNRIGNVIEIISEDYAYGGITFEGALRLNHVASTIADSRKYNVDLTQTTISNGAAFEVIMSGQSEIILQDHENETPRAARALILSNIIGNFADNTSFSRQDELSQVYRSHCWNEGILFSGNGQTNLSLNNSQYAVSYSGACNYLIEMTDEIGTSFQIDLSNPTSI